MKKYISMTLLVCSSIMAFSAEEPPVFDHRAYSQKAYSQKDLMHVRDAWVGVTQEKMEHYQNQASERNDGQLLYLSLGGNILRSIDPNDKTISTMIDHGREVVTLSYDDFTRLVLPSCPAETDLIERYTKNYRSAIKDYNQLRWGDFEGGNISEKDEQGRDVYRKIKMTSSGKNALLDSLEAKDAALLPWGFKWLAAYWVENCRGFDTKFGMNDCIDVVKPVVEEHLAAMIGKANVNYSNVDLEDKINKHAYRIPCVTVLRNRVANRQRTIQQLSVDIYDEIDKEIKIPLDENELLQESKYHYSIRLHKQKPVDYKLYNRKPEYREKFCENLLPMIQDRDEHIAQLKAENPVPEEVNATTNNFARLLDRIAK
jgi:hypothetical protein